MRELADIEQVARDGVWIATVSGEIDLSNADAVLKRLVDAVDDDSGGLVLDLSRLDYLDSAGVRILFKLGQTVSDAGGSLRAVVPQEAQIRRVLELADVEQVLALDETVDAAIDSLRNGQPGG